MLIIKKNVSKLDWIKIKNFCPSKDTEGNEKAEQRAGDGIYLHCIPLTGNAKNS